MQLDNLIEKYETDSAELLKVGAVEPAEEKQLIADRLKELKIARVENEFFKKQFYHLTNEAKEVWIRDDKNEFKDITTMVDILREQFEKGVQK